MSTQLSLGALGGIHLAPGVLDEQRGAWCTPPEYAVAVGPFFVDPFSNERSSIRSQHACWLERGDDGFGLDRRSMPGAFYTQSEHRVASAESRVWIQPPYNIVLDAIAHYGHTRSTALLRLDTSTEWFERLHAISEVIMVPKRDRLEFVPPPGVKPSSNPFPHGLYYARAEDVTPAVESLCYRWRLR